MKNRISTVLMSFVLFIFIAFYVSAEDSGPESQLYDSDTSGVGTGFATECAQGLKWDKDWTKIYSNGYGSKIKTVITRDLNPQLSPEKYNQGLTEKDIAVIYSKDRKEVTILYGREINQAKIMASESRLKTEFAMAPCSGFKQFIDLTSKSSMLKTTTSKSGTGTGSSSETGTGSTTGTATGTFDCAAEFTKAQNYKPGPDDDNKVLAKLYTFVYARCKSNIYGARSALIAAGYYKNSDLSLSIAADWYKYAYDASTNFPDIARESLYEIIKIRSNVGCSAVQSIIDEYKQKFSGQSQEYDANISLIEQKCAAAIAKQSKCKQLFAYGMDIKVILIPDGYSDINAFISDAKSLVQDGLFADDFMKQYQNKFTIYYTDGLNNDICDKNYNGNSDDYSCDDYKAFKISISCPEAVYVVLSQNYFRSYAQFDKAVFLSMDYKERPEGTFRHELGHAIFGLADEYVEPSKGSRPKEPNCFSDQTQAKYYWENRLGLTEGSDFDYHRGCSYTEDNIKGIRNSVMSNSELMYFGPINEAHIRQYMTNR